jgi:SAM-dependent methyltransferase
MVMGTGREQAALWGPGARDWADYNEPMCTPFYQAVLDATAVGTGTKILDIGCGGGFALLLAASRGATVSGLDATASLLDIARERVPGASLTIGDLEDPLPYDEGAFDVVTSFNSVQYAADPVSVIKGMSHVTRPGGLVSFVVWGPPEQCESAVLFSELGPLLPPAPPAAPGAVAWSEEGKLKDLAAQAGLTPLTVADVPNPLAYPDLATAVRTQLSSGPARQAIEHSGLPAVRGALTRAFAGSRKPDATYRQENVFRYLVAQV